MEKSGYGRFAESQRNSGMRDPIEDGFMGRKAAINASLEGGTGPKEMDPEETDLGDVAEPVFVNQSDSELFEDMLTPITENGEDIEKHDYDKMQENRFSSSEESDELEEEDKAGSGEGSVAVNPVEKMGDALEDINKAFDELEDTFESSEG